MLEVVEVEQSWFGDVLVRSLCVVGSNHDKCWLYAVLISRSPRNKSRLNQNGARGGLGSPRDLDDAGRDIRGKDYQERRGLRFLPVAQGHPGGDGRRQRGQPGRRHPPELPNWPPRAAVKLQRSHLSGTKSLLPAHEWKPPDTPSRNGTSAGRGAVGLPSVPPTLPAPHPPATPSEHPPGSAGRARPQGPAGLPLLSPAFQPL